MAMQRRCGHAQHAEVRTCPCRRGLPGRSALVASAAPRPAVRRGRDALAHYLLLASSASAALHLFLLQEHVKSVLKAGRAWPPAFGGAGALPAAARTAAAASAEATRVARVACLSSPAAGGSPLPPSAVRWPLDAAAATIRRRGGGVWPCLQNFASTAVANSEPEPRERRPVHSAPSKWRPEKCRTISPLTGGVPLTIAGFKIAGSTASV